MKPYYAIEARSTTTIPKEKLDEALRRLENLDAVQVAEECDGTAAGYLRLFGFEADLSTEGSLWFGGAVLPGIDDGEMVLQSLADLIEAGSIAAWIDTGGHSYVDRFDGRLMVREDPYAQYMATKPAPELQGNDIKAWYRNRYPQDTLAVYLKGGISFNDIAQAMLDGKDFYSLIEDDPYSVDTLVRERIFEGMAEKLGVSYDDIYKLWLAPEDCQDNGWPQLIAEEKDREGLANRSENDLKQDREER